MKKFLPLALALLGGIAAHAAEGTPDRFRNTTAGFEVIKPAGWHYATAAQNQENLKGVKLSDAELQAALQQYATAPLVVMTKYPEPYADVNPSFKVTLKPFGSMKGVPPVQLLGAMVPQFQKAFRQVAIVQPPVAVDVAGIRSAYARMHYTMDTQGGPSFALSSELWIVPHGDYFFMLGAGTRQDEKNGSRREIAEILNTIRITPQGAK